MDTLAASMAPRRERALARLSGWLRAGGVPFMEMAAALPSPSVPSFSSPDLLIGGGAPLALTIIPQDREGDLLFVEALRLVPIATFDQMFSIPAYVAVVSTEGAVSAFWFRPAVLPRAPAPMVAGSRLLEIPAVAGFDVSTAGPVLAALAMARAWRPGVHPRR